ncbi:Rab8, rab family GTPase [Emiliania huxleyi CCMP1516]|uniref:Uncharacterized protein n=2 Tax=Emiliania huxleyi TaxID=2903 RepID=A0A0D3KY99_EMIH1|nr:Rab8, rab family GTPase [Emiliania huxleyi CCMP1516]EOD40734.1 Rab8, rab family GTPase [Emiliania huxleyi CCMP1516]|eukprot:XP_005793163.1 Rab8, rab family GTPase [Emiliania huxleyi CCMP1516]
MARPADKQYDVLIKLLLIGDSGVGKSSILVRFADDSFSQSFIATIGIDFKIRSVELDGKRVKLQIWDTAGQERFKTITTAYYRGAMGILLVYDVTNEDSFSNISSWMRAIEQHASDSVNKVLLGNKADTSGPLVSQRRVSAERGQRLAGEYGLQFFEVSAKSNVNIEQAFFTIARDIHARLQNTSAAAAAGASVRLGEGSAKPGGAKAGCC